MCQEDNDGRFVTEYKNGIPFYGVLKAIGRNKTSIRH